MMKLYFLRPVLRQFTCVQIANFSAVCMGLSVVWASPMVIKLGDAEQTVLPQPITADQAAWISSINMLAGLISVLSCGFLMDNLGRKTTILITFLPRLIFCFFAIFASEYWMILAARCFGGTADVLFVSAISTYTSEIASKTIRGASGTTMQINSAVGMLLMLGVGPFISYLAMNILMTCIVVAAFIPLLLLPESPFYLYTKGKTNQSLEVLTFLYGTEELAHEEIRGYSSNKVNEKEINKWELLRDRTVIKTLFMGTILTIGQQLTGHNVVNMYLQTIMESANTSISSEISSLIIGVIQLVACLCTFFLTNRFGRKTIICSSLMGMLVGMIGLGTFFTLAENGTEIRGFLNFLPLISVAIVIYGYNAGMGSLFWILIAELFYGPVRPYGMALCGFLTALSVFGLNLVFPTLIAAIGASGTYWIFSGGCVFICTYVALFVPETKDRTFAEIQTALGRRDSTAKVVGRGKQ